MNAITELPLWGLLLQLSKYETGGSSPSPNYVYEKIRQLSYNAEQSSSELFKRKNVLIIASRIGYIVCQFDDENKADDEIKILNLNEIREFIQNLPESFIASNCNIISDKRHLTIRLSGKIANTIQQIMETTCQPVVSIGAVTPAVAI